MGREIERKFLVHDPAWREALARAGAPERFQQFYLARRSGFSVRLRVIDGARAVLTLKSGAGLSRGEYEYEVPLADARELADARIGAVIAKHRFRIPHGRHTIELDVFEGDLAPLVVAEVELASEADALDPPSWFAAEVTADNRYTNAALAEHGLPEGFGA